MSRLWNKMLGLALALSALSVPAAQASTGLFAKAEFLYLKHSGNFLDFSEGKTYAEVKGTSFIALQMAENEERTCLFGFNAPGADSEEIVPVRTRFVCYDHGRYELVQLKEWCEVGTLGCEIDPAAISIGIGNLNILQKDPALAPSLNPLLPTKFPTEVFIKQTLEETQAGEEGILVRPLPGRYFGNPNIRN